MNRTKLKNYAPQARRDFIQAMMDRAAFYGLTAKKVEPVLEKGDVAVISGREHPRSVAKKRKALEDRVRQHGFQQTMEALAYTWFDRLAAIRFMELHGYLDHGYRALSHPEGKPIPELLEHAEHVDMPGLKRETVIDLKLAGNREAELYRLLLLAQCNALNTAMPFLFEKIEDETELLLPDNLLHSDSLIRKLVCEIDEEDWKEVEIIGWLYQFYISEKKDEVMGKVVASEDIPAATQLFTPNWIVKYLVQNSLGRLWLATYPNSALRQQMEYYIEPAEQTPEVQDQLKAITPTELNPEELTLMDPAAGSGHILVEGYDLFKAIYQERGYRAKDIPRLILEKNLFGLEIDDRAAQLAAFALMMKARADDRRIFESDVKPNILAFQDSQGMDAAAITHALNSPINKEATPPSEYLFDEIEHAETPLFSTKVLVEKGHVSQSDIASLLELFENAQTFGSLLQVPPNLAATLPGIEQRLNDVMKHGDLTHAPANVLKPLLQQAQFLARQYDTVVANPPYMTSDNYNPHVKRYIARAYKKAKADLCTCFIERAFAFVRLTGFVSEVTMQNWMFIARFDDFRKDMLENHTLVALAQLGPHAFPSIGGKVVQVAAFVSRPSALKQYKATYLRLIDGTAEEKATAFHRTGRFVRDSHFYTDIPTSPLLYWITDDVRKCLINGVQLGEFAEPRCGMNTGDNPRFVRFWHEVQANAIGFHLENRIAAFDSGCRWVPYNKGGKYRRWYGNCDSVLRFDRQYYDILANMGNKLPSREFYFKRSLTWSKIGDLSFAIRCSDNGFLFDGGGSSAFPPEEWYLSIAGFLCSKVAHGIIKSLNPTVNFQSGDVAALPILKEPLLARRSSINECVEEIVCIARRDWDSFETSWDFRALPVLLQNTATLQQSLQAANADCLAMCDRVKELEEENNRLFIEAYGLQDELSPEVPDDQITLYRPDREEDIKRLLSYAIGCIMGRYSLDKQGLIYAHSGNKDFDTNQYKTFPADDDGIIPLLATDWGLRDDAASRIVQFVGVAWPKQHLEENLKFIADSLGPTGNEQPRETIRHYLATGFYKHHLSMYKKRPIYWLFSSGKQRAFQCLVYLHRYHEGTLARMRTEYVIPIQGQIASRIEQLEGDKAKATSTSHRKKLQKEQDGLKKQQAELLIFDEKLKHAADKKINIDLDDGVKVNYGKFGDLLAEVKAITGGKDEE